MLYINWFLYDKENTQSYLVFRTFIRTDDHFYLWVRLTAISAIIALTLIFLLLLGLWRERYLLQQRSS